MPPRLPRKQRTLLKEIGERIADARRNRGITQVDLAKRVGVSQGNISGYERGAFRIPCDQLMVIAQVLGVSADELLGMRPPPKTFRTGTRLHRRFQLLENLSKKDQDALGRFLDAWVTRVRRPQPDA